MNNGKNLPEVLHAPLDPYVGLLLESRIPARLAWVAKDGTPRVVPIWFLWTGTEVAMSTFAGSRKLAAIIDGTMLAVTIDTEQFPYRSLNMRGRAAIRPTDGVAEEYIRAANRYLGNEVARHWIEFLGDPDQVVISMRPTWASASDMATDSPFMQADQGE